MAKFGTFATADAYVDVNQLVSSMKSRENSELYLYLGVLQYRKNTFPLFYIPLSVDQEEATTKYRISLKPQVLVYNRDCCENGIATGCASFLKLYLTWPERII